MKKIKLYITAMLAGLLLPSWNNKKSNSKKNKTETAVIGKREIWTKDQANN